MGSVYYMSPEQVRGGTVDARSDIYSFGITLYEMLAGRKPFQADTAYSVLNAHLNEAPVPPQQINPQLPAGLNEIVMRAIAKAPADRFQSADDFRNAIRGVQQQRAQAAAPTQTPQSGFAPVAQAGFAPVAVPAARPAAAAKSQRGLWIGVGAAVALLALIGVAIVLPHLFATHAGQRGQPAAATETAAPQNPATQPAAATSPAASASQQNPPAPPADQTPMAQQPVQTRSAAARSTAPVRREAQSGAAGGTTANQTSVPAGPSPEQIHQAHNRIADLNARAAAAKSGVESIRRQQQAQGYDLRGDVLAAMNRLEQEMHAANQALNGNDLATANQSMDSADQDLAVVEKFLGQ
jgi:serine/threonine-protein kinase